MFFFKKIKIEKTIYSIELSVLAGHKFKELIYNIQIIICFFCLLDAFSILQFKRNIIFFFFVINDIFFYLTQTKRI